MKLSYRFLFVTLLMGIIFFPAQRVIAADTLTVEWWDGTEAIDNILYTTIAADTTSAGVHVAVDSIPNRVYQLRKGGYYYLFNRIENDGFHLRLVGEEPGFADEGGTVNFFLEENRIRFEINTEVAKQDQLKISSKLLSLAKIVPVKRY